MTCTRLLGAVAVLVLLAACPLSLAGAQEAQPDRANRPAAPLTNGQLAAMLDAYAIVQAQRVLDLADDQYGQFVARLKRLHETRRRNTIARNKMLQELRRLTAPNAATEEATLLDRLKALREHDEQAAQAMQREYAAVDELLNARQQARFRILEDRLEQQKLDLLMRARERARGAGQRRGDGLPR